MPARTFSGTPGDGSGKGSPCTEAVELWRAAVGIAPAAALRGRSVAALLLGSLVVSFLLALALPFALAALGLAGTFLPQHAALLQDLGLVALRR